MKISYLGYKEETSDSVVIKGGSTTVLDAKLKQAALRTGKVIVKTKQQ